VREAAPEGAGDAEAQRLDLRQRMRTRLVDELQKFVHPELIAFVEPPDNAKPHLEVEYQFDTVPAKEGEAGPTQVLRYTLRFRKTPEDAQPSYTKTWTVPLTGALANRSPEDVLMSQTDIALRGMGTGQPGLDGN
jgi:hypothetical protein